MMHTPGPWAVDDDGGLDIRSAGAGLIADVNHFPVPTAQERANARLIAAAPDLLEAAKECLKWFETPAMLPTFPVSQRLRAAIAKATE